MDPKVSARHRNRASNACTACRKARTRCFTAPDQTVCSGCRDGELECVFDEKDGRKRRTTAKDVNDALSKRLQHLEDLLKGQNENSVEHEARHAAAVNSTAIDVQPSAGEPPPPYNAPSVEPAERTDETEEQAQNHLQPASVLKKAVPFPIHLELTSGRVRYFGPTTNLGVLSATTQDPCVDQKQTSHWPIGILVRELSPESHNYLMDLFWACHNAVVHLVHLDAFYLDQERGGTRFYSTFLHLAMLATGFRYADKKRPDIQKLLASGTSSSLLHEKAKAMAMHEIDRPGGLTSIQGFSLLGELEFYQGRDETGWMFTGIACRMLLDAGLHVDSKLLNLEEREIQIRHMILWSCLTVDKFWALYLGRPTALKTADMAPSCLSFDFARLLACRPAGHEKKIGTRIYEALLHLMEIAGPLCSVRVPQTVDDVAGHSKMAAMDHELKGWRSRLPNYLKWPSDKQAVMPPSYYLLHAQYHAALILLYRPFLPHNEDKGTGSADETDINYHFASLARSACVENAKSIVRLFQQYQSKFDLAQVYGIGVQHAGTAATALMGEIVLQTDTEVRKSLVEYLSSLQKSIRLMSRSYRTARLMVNVIDEFLASLQSTDQTLGLTDQLLLDKDVLPGSALIETDGAFHGTETGRPTGSRKRTRSDYDTAGPCAPSPQALPFWSPSFLETLGDDTAFSGLGNGQAMTELGSPWANTWHPEP